MITQIYKWKCTLQSISPLRIGSTDDDIVVDQLGLPFIPGTSLAGACRAFVQSIASEDEVNMLFGSATNKTRNTILIISDGKSNTHHDLEERTGIRIDGPTKTNASRGLFTRKMLAPGATFNVTITLKTTKAMHERFAEIVIKMLQAIHTGTIRLGAYKSIGSGKLTVKSCERVHYDCTNEADLIAYVNDSKSYEKVTFTNDVMNEGFVQITLKGRTDSPLLIGGVYPHDSAAPDETFITTADGKPLIPGSSIKGVLRHRVNRIANILQIRNKEKYVAYLFGPDDPEADEGMGTLQFEDIIINKRNTKVFNRIAINPFTGGTRDGMIIEQETVVGTFETKLQYQLKEKEADVSLALLLFALRDLALGKLSVGSGAAIGRGFLKIEEMSMEDDDKEIVFDVDAQEIIGDDTWLQQLQESLETAK